MTKNPLPGSCPVILRRVCYGFLTLHLLAVVAEPLAFFSRSDFQTAPEFSMLRRVVAPYAEWMYLDHGYFFFAPNPGPNHLVGTKPTNSDVGALPAQDKAAQVLFPDRRKQWPRLRYHRYFMLSEFYNNSFAPTELLPEDREDPLFFQRWKEDRAFYELLQNSIRHALEVPGDLIRLERPLPSAQEVLGQRVRLDDSRRILELSDSPESLVPEHLNPSEQPAAINPPTSTPTPLLRLGPVAPVESSGAKETSEPIEAGRIPR